MTLTSSDEDIVAVELDRQNCVTVTIVIADEDVKDEVQVQADDSVAPIR